MFVIKESVNSVLKGHDSFLIKYRQFNIKINYKVLNRNNLIIKSKWKNGMMECFRIANLEKNNIPVPTCRDSNIPIFQYSIVSLFHKQVSVFKSLVVK